jgi:hypothetical protein
LLGFLSAAKEYKAIVVKLLAQHGIRKPDPAGWYALPMWLAVLQAVQDKLGERTLFAFGKRVHENVEWPQGPETITTVEGGLAVLEAGYHLNHRLHGEPMFDRATGVIKDGIGHYLLREVGPRRCVMVCDNPYPSEFDRGLLAGVARRFALTADVVRDETKSTRKRDGDSCTYIVTW